MHVCSFVNLRNCTRCDIKSQLKAKRERLSENKIIRLLMQHYESFCKNILLGKLYYGNFDKGNKKWKPLYINENSNLNMQLRSNLSIFY